MQYDLHDSGTNICVHYVWAPLFRIWQGVKTRTVSMNTEKCSAESVFRSFGMQIRDSQPYGLNKSLKRATYLHLCPEISRDISRVRATPTESEAANTSVQGPMSKWGVFCPAVASQVNTSLIVLELSCSARGFDSVQFMCLTAGKSLIFKFVFRDAPWKTAFSYDLYITVGYCGSRPHNSSIVWRNRFERFNYRKCYD